jgi:hypothetical protein
LGFRVDKETKKPFLRELENFDFSEMGTKWVLRIGKV